MRIRSTLTIIAAVGLLAACGGQSDDPEQDGTEENGTEETEEDGSEEDAAGEGQDGEEEASAEDLEDMDEEELQEEMLGDAEDPNEMVSDGVFAGQGVLLPVPDGFELDQMAYAQGAVVAASGETEQLAAEAVDMDEMPEEQEISYDEVIEQNLEQIPEEPTSDEEVDLEGAARARALRFDDLSTGAQQPEGEDGEAEETPETSALIVFAENDDGRLAVFNYLAESDEFDEDVSDELLAVAGFDPDSDPTPPQPMEQEQQQEQEQD
ncbi:MAG: hypothetical protein ACOC9I_01050 [Actinomycetota bacterium]